MILQMEIGITVQQTGNQNKYFYAFIQDKEFSFDSRYFKQILWGKN